MPTPKLEIVCNTDFNEETGEFANIEESKYCYIPITANISVDVELSSRPNTGTMDIHEASIRIYERKYGDTKKLEVAEAIAKLLNNSTGIDITGLEGSITQEEQLLHVYLDL